MSVLSEIRAGYGVVALDWPEVKNAMGPDEANELAGAIRAVADEPGINALVITGSGGAFCAGGNVKGMAARQGMDPVERRKLVYGAYQGMIRSVIDVPVPTIAAIDGPAIGMGFDIALACDIRVFGPDGWARQGWARIGAVPGTGGALFLGLKAPGALWRILPEQTKVDGRLAESLGLGEASSELTALDRAAQLATSLAELPPATVRGYVELSRASLRSQLDAHLAAALDIQVGLLADPGFAKRATATIAKDQKAD